MPASKHPLHAVRWNGSLRASRMPSSRELDRGDHRGAFASGYRINGAVIPAEAEIVRDLRGIPTR